jgi:hypothetical protein
VRNIPQDPDESISELVEHFFLVNHPDTYLRHQVPLLNCRCGYWPLHFYSYALCNLFQSIINVLSKAL